MSSPSSLDPESFQKLLADAFVVQESDLETRSLSALVELQQFIPTCEPDADQAMLLIADHARKVSNATGIAVALIRRDQLIYRAGSGSAAPFVGRHVTAILVAAQNQSRGEILRVEDAETDVRIEAEICRQFGARALLLLPIFDNRRLVGMLEVIFSDAHAFRHQEVRTYQLMASLLGEVLSHAAQLQERNVAGSAERSAIEQRAEKIASSAQQSHYDGGSESRLVGKPATCQVRGAQVIVPDLAAPRRLVQAASIMRRRVERIPSYKRWTAAAVLVLVGWTAYSDRRPASPVEASALQKSNAIERRFPSGPAKPSASSELKPQNAPVPKSEARKNARTTPEWVRLGNNELDYVAQDVTVRYFTAVPTARRARLGQANIKHIGKDVTVRYFAPNPALSRMQREDSEIHYVSEDVTVRSFTPKHAATPKPLSVGSTVQPVDR